MRILRELLIVFVALSGCKSGSNRSPSSNTDRSPSSNTDRSPSSNTDRSTPSNTEQSTSSPPTKNLDACSFFTGADASEAFGTPVKLQNQELQVCVLAVPGLGSNGSKIDVLVDMRAATDVWDAVAARNPGPALVAGLGEKAGWSDSTHGGSPSLIKLYVVKNGKTLTITVSGDGVDTDSIKQKSQALASRALPQM